MRLLVSMVMGLLDTHMTRKDKEVMLDDLQKLNVGDSSCSVTD